MKLRKWVIKLLLFIQIVTLIVLVSIDDFELCLSSLLLFGVLLGGFTGSSLLLYRYGGIEN